MFYNLISKAIKGESKISYLENIYLVSKIKNGNMEVLIKWIDKNEDKLYKIAYSYLYHHSDVEDAFQNTFIKVYENISGVKKPKYFETWFISILLNECRKILRFKKNEMNLEYIEEISYEDKNYDPELEVALLNLEDKYKDVIILKYISGYSEKEISEILDIKLGTVKSRTSRGLDSLRKYLGEGYNE